MLKENPFIHSTELSAAFYAILEQLSRPGIALTAFVICIGIACGALLTAWRSHRTSSGPSKCAWTRDTLQPHARMTRWVCSSCGGYSFGKGRRPPKTCRAYDPKQKI